MAAHTTGERVTHHPGRVMLMLAMRCPMVPLYFGGRGGRVDSARVMFLQKLLTFMRKSLATPTDDTIVAVLNLMDLSLRPDRVLIAAPAAGHGSGDPPLSARSGDQPSRIAPASPCDQTGADRVPPPMAAMAMLESFVDSLSLAAATVMWQLAITLRLAVLSPLLAESVRRDKESSKE